MQRNQPDTSRAPRPGSWRRPAFTLVELLIVVGILATLISILVPSLSKARNSARRTICLHNLHVLGQGMVMYAVEHRDELMPGRMPKLDDYNWQVKIAGGTKYRPTFLATMGGYVGVPAFNNPQETRLTTDPEGQPGDKQNYSNKTYLCPARMTWTDERNGAYGYNYQFLGNSRLRDESNPFSFKNWPVKMTKVRNPGACVAVADSMGTAGSFPKAARQPYLDNSSDPDRFGNEGFNLDPPRVDPADGEMANWDRSPQSASPVDDRHLNKGNVLWVDGHVSSESHRTLGYEVLAEGVIGFNGSNRLFTLDGTEQAWLQTAAEP